MKFRKTLICAFILASMLASICISASAAGTSVPKPGKPYTSYVKEFDLVSYLEEVEDRYNVVRDLVHYSDDVHTIKVNKQVVLRVCDGIPIRLEIQEGFDDFDFLRIFTYDTDSNLIFCYYENDSESYRMYFYEGEIVKMTYRDKDSGYRYDANMEDAQREYSDWADYALYESEYYRNKAGY